MERGVAQLVARTAGGREVAGSSPVTPTTDLSRELHLIPLTLTLELSNRREVNYANSNY